MAIKLLEGVHITATEKKAIERIIKEVGIGNWTLGKKRYIVTLIEGNQYSVVVRQNATDMWGNKKVEKSHKIIEVL